MCILCLGAALFAEAAEEPTLEKFYLSPGSLYMNDEGLFIDIEGRLCPVTSVKSDERGVYVGLWDFKWNCIACKKPNFNWFSFCAWCGKPREKPPTE